MPEPSHVSISVLFQRQEPKRFIGSLRGYVPHKKRLKKPPDLLGSVLPKCAHSLRTQDQGAGTGSSKGLELQKKEEKTSILLTEEELASLEKSYFLHSKEKPTSKDNWD